MQSDAKKPTEQTAPRDHRWSVAEKVTGWWTLLDGDGVELLRTSSQEQADRIAAAHNAMLT